MRTANGLVTTPAAPGWLSKPRGFVIAVAVASAGAIAVGQHWLALADLVPLLLVLPCAAMMLKCMKRSPQPDTTQASAQGDTPATTGTWDPRKPEPVHWSG
jgi:hypothetical protein